METGTLSQPSFDPVRYKAGQRQLWDRVAAGWEKWWPLQEQGLQHISDRLVDLAEIKPGNRVLDVGTGIGEPAITAGRRLGSAGRLIATDQSPQMLAIARKRALAVGLTNLEFREMDTEVLDFPENSFDAVLGRFSLMFLPDLPIALDKIRRLLAPGGKFATSVWAAASKVPMVSLALDLARSMFQPPPPPPGAPSLFGLAGGILARAFTQAGFNEVQAEEAPCIWELPSAEVLVQFLRDVNVSLTDMVARQPAERQAAYWQALAAVAQEYARPDGSLKITSMAICVVGQR